MGKSACASLGLSPAPGGALRAVFENNARLSQFLADGVGTGKVARLTRGEAFGDELLDVLGGIAATSATAQVRGWLRLQ